MLDDIMKMLRDAARQEQRPKILVGTIPSFTLIRYKQSMEKKHELMNELRSKIDEIAAKYSKMAEKEVEELTEEYQAKVEQTHDDGWNPIYTQLNLDKEASLTINPKTGEVYKFTDTEDEEDNDAGKKSKPRQRGAFIIED